VVASFALDANVAALFTTPIFGVLTATFAHVKGPANGVPMIVKLVVPLELIRTVGLGFT
jgi:hypothetical protein